MDERVGAAPDAGHEPAVGSAGDVDVTVATADVATADVATADVTTADVTTADVSAADVPADLAPAVTMLRVDAAQHARELLAEHVPLALLVDLLAPTGDTSDDLLAAEGLPGDAWWTSPPDAGAREA